MIRISASALGRTEKCPASASLPRVRQLHADATAGTEEHAELEAEAPENAERAYALDPIAGTARFLGRGIQRAYDVDWSREIPGTIDLEELEPDLSKITDHKTGFGFHVTPAKDNLQLAHNALCSTIVHKKSNALVVLNFTATGRQDEHAMDAFDLANARERIANIWRAANEPRPVVATGDHCWRCECITNCPAHRALLEAFNAGQLGDVLPMDGLTPEVIADGYQRFKALKRIVGLLEKTYRAVASTQPIDLGGGKFLGEVTSSQEELDGKTAHHVLLDLHGEAVAKDAIDLSVTKASLERALAKIAPPRGKARLMREALAAIEAAGGVATKFKTTVEEFQDRNMGEAQREQSNGVG